MFIDTILRPVNLLEERKKDLTFFANKVSQNVDHCTALSVAGHERAELFPVCKSEVATKNT